jgi:hypothetical protein
MKSAVDFGASLTPNIKPYLIDCYEILEKKS